MYALNAERMFFDMSEDQAIVIDSTSGTYFAMNMLASHAFDHLVKGAGLQAVTDALKRLDGCPEDIHTRLEGFVAQLLACEILVADNDSSFEGEIEAAPVWFMEGTDFTLERYQDMADLILADPVHDVDVEFGWPVLKEDEGKE